MLAKVGGHIQNEVDDGLDSLCFQGVSSHEHIENSEDECDPTELGFSDDDEADKGTVCYCSNDAAGAESTKLVDSSTRISFSARVDI